MLIINKIKWFAIVLLFANVVNAQDKVDLGLSVKWASENLPSHYAWGETVPKQSYTMDNYKWFSGEYKSYPNDIRIPIFVEYGSKNLRKEDDLATTRLGEGWRMPTKEEFEELIDNCDWSLETRDNQIGYLVTSRKNTNSIFFPTTGCSEGQMILGEGYLGYYWSSTCSSATSDNYYAYYLHLTTDSVSQKYVVTGGVPLYYGLAIRPVFDGRRLAP